VVPGEIAGGQSATRTPDRGGHRRIGTIMGEGWMEAAQDRLEGYRRALATADIPFDPNLWWTAIGRRARVITAPQAAGAQGSADAIFCQNDRTAIGCFEALKEAGLSIPEDISVVDMTMRKSRGTCTRGSPPRSCRTGPWGNGRSND